MQSASGATVALWVKPGSVIPIGGFRDLVSLSVGGTPNPTKTSRLALSLKGDGSTGGQVFLGGRSTDTENQKSVTTAQTVAVGTWTHVVGVISFQNSTLKVWINGQLAATAAGVGFASPMTPNTSCRNSALGAQDDGVGNAFHGSLDQVRIYNRALSDAEVQGLASGEELRAHWTLDDGSGLVASDASGNLHVGTLKNGLETGWAAGGQIGGALRFDGADDYVEVAGAAGLLRNVNGASVALWIKPSSVIPAGNFRELLSVSVGGAPSDVSRFALALRGDGISAGDVFLGARSADDESQKNTVHDSSLAVGEWTHVCGVVSYQHGTLEVYINGFLAAQAPAAFRQPRTANTASLSIALGAQDTGGSNRYAGTMDAVRVYGRALTACEVQELAGRDGLQAYWKFDETSGTRAADSSPTGLAATLKNGAGFAPGRRGNALNLDGVDDYADLGLNPPILRGANAATVAAWIQLGSIPPSGSFREIVSIAIGGSASNTSRLAFAIRGNASGTADLFAGGRSADSEAQRTLTAAAGIRPGAWHHVAATLDVGHHAIRIYLDGIQIASADVAFSQPTMPPTFPAIGAIGAQDTGDSNRIHARIDELRVYCRALSGTEIASLAAPERPSPPVLSVVEEGHQQVRLSWTAVSGADFYTVKRSTTSGTGHVALTSTGKTTFTDTGLANDITYFYIVTAQNAAGESDPSNEAPATPRAGVPPAPVLTSPAPGANLNTASPTVSGTSSSPGLTITLLVDGSPNGTTVSGVAGNWTLSPETPLAEGIRNLTATATNTSGTSPESGVVQVRIDTVAPVLTSPQPPDGSSTTNATPTLSASWNDPVPGSDIDPTTALVKLDDVPVSASVHATGFTFTPTSPLALGSHTV
ncbi:MAG: LamG-like jellyroll fold domain-containing protein [Planctomycetota bacterium]